MSNLLKASSRAWITPAKNKFNAKRTWVGDIAFDSGKEAKRWCELQILQKAGDITDLQRQVRYKIEVNGQKITTYVADFSYRDAKGVQHVEDAKGGKATITQLFKLKMKLMKAVHGITVEIV